MLKDDFDFHEFINKLSPQDLEQFANDSGTTVSYLKKILIYKKKTPRLDLIEAMAIASNGTFTKAEFVHWLYDLKVA